MSVHNQKLPDMKTKKMWSIKKKKKTIETDTEMTDMLQLANSYFKWLI